jgi:hypothetical protein
MFECKHCQATFETKGQHTYHSRECKQSFVLQLGGVGRHKRGMNEASECPIFSGPELVDGGKEIIWSSND